MTAFVSMISGAGIGAGIAIILYVLGFALELLNCAWQIISCDCEGGDAIPGMWSGDSFIHIFVFCTICGAIIGLVYGIYKMKVASAEAATIIREKNNEEKRRQIEKWEGEVKQRALIVNNSCEKNKEYDKSVVSTMYESKTQMNLILRELTNMAELKGKVDSIVDDLSKNGGVNL